MKMPKQCKLGTLLPLLALLASTGSLQAGYIATNAAVPAAMNATGGTQGDPKIYVFNDGFERNFLASSISVGNATGSHWVRLEIKEGAKVISTNGNTFVGSDSSTFRTEFNSAWIMGAGSSLTLGAARLGGKSALNTLAVMDGGTLTLNNELRAGYSDSGNNSTNNKVIVDNGTVNVLGRLRVGYGVTHDYCSILVRNGGLVTASAAARIGIRGGNYCDYRVEGEGSKIESAYTGAGAISIGEVGTAHHNTLTIVDGGVVKLTHASGTLSITVDAMQGGSGVRFAKGVLAVMGNRPTLVPANRAWLWDGDSWEQAPGGWQGTYYPDETAAAAAGYSGFGGYTVFTGGKSIADALKTTLVVIQ